MQIWKWFTGHMRIAPHPPGHILHVAGPLTWNGINPILLGTKNQVAPWIIVSLIAAAVLAGAFWIFSARRVH